MFAALALLAISPFVAIEDEPLPGTQPWTDRGDPAAAMVAGLHRFLDRETAGAPARRDRAWAEADPAKIAARRPRLAAILGAVDPRVAPVELATDGTTDRSATFYETPSFTVRAVRWPVYDDFQAEGLLIEPRGREPIANVVAMADCDQLPESLVGIQPGIDPTEQTARLLAEAGCRVLVPALLNRESTFSGNPAVRMTNLSHREWIWRMAFETGRQPIGYEVDAVRAAVDWFTREGQPDRPIGVIGSGEGGRVALYAAAIDDRIGAAWVRGAFGPREGSWSEPIDRDLFGLLEEFGDAEVGAMIAPRALVVEAAPGPIVTGPPPPREGRADAASGRLGPIPTAAVEAEFARLTALGPAATLVLPGRAKGIGTAPSAQVAFHRALGLDPPQADPGSPATATAVRTGPDPIERTRRIVAGMTEHTQNLLRTSELRRDRLWSTVEAKSVESWVAVSAKLRDRLWDDVIGRFPPASEPIGARTAKILDEPKFIGYAVRLEVWPDVFASGVLLLPKDLKPGERRPVVVCQHGLEGTPEPIVDPRVDSVYKSYGAQLADRGYVVYAPQNPYKGHDDFRLLQRKAHPIKKSLFAAIVRQHERTLEWLGTLPMVDPARIAFYGLSYGGKTAMRVPALLPGYCLSICSADFNEWVVKCTNLDRPYSYMYTVEYDMYEWDLASGFNYAEMAGLIAPRPFFVERGHGDGVAPDEWIGYEFAKVKRRYDLLGLADRVGIGYFNAGHQIDGKATFEFLDRHLKPKRD